MNGWDSPWLSCFIPMVPPVYKTSTYFSFGISIFGFGVVIFELDNRFYLLPELVISSPLRK